MSVPIFVVCSACGVRMKAPAAMAGKTAPCPKCREPVRVPPLAADADDTDTAALVAAAARALADVDAARDRDDTAAAAGHLGQAARAAEALIATDPNGAAGWLTRGLVAAKDGDFAAAARDLGRVIRRDAAGLGAPELASLLDRCGELYEAVTFMAPADLGENLPPGLDEAVAALRKVLVLADRAVPEPGVKARELVARAAPAAAVTCPACQEPLKGHVARCPHCTEVLHWMACPDCRKTVATTVTQKWVGEARGDYQPVYNCIECGKKLAGPDCFIATAAFGTGLEPEVDVLRQFRDRVMLRSLVGRAAVAAYYATSPPIAASIRHRATARAVVRGLLRPVVWGARVALRGRA